MEVKRKGTRQCVQKLHEVLIANKVLGFHNKPRVGRTAAPLPEVWSPDGLQT